VTGREIQLERENKKLKAQVEALTAPVVKKANAKAYSKQDIRKLEAAVDAKKNDILFKFFEECGMTLHEYDFSENGTNIKYSFDANEGSHWFSTIEEAFTNYLERTGVEV
jgi:hypothetical protein